MKKSYTVGLIAAPEFAENLTKKLSEKLPKKLKENLTKQVDWSVEMIVDPMTGAAETVEEIFTKARNYKTNHDWDYVVCLTDLPVFHEESAVAADINEDKGVILLSIPAFGWISLIKKIEKAILYSFEELEEFKDSNEQAELRLIWRGFSLSPIKRIKRRLTETNNMHIRYLLYPKALGKIRLLIGMAYANNPFKMMSSLTDVVAVAFTTGGFGLIFTTMWKLSHLFSNWRLLTITLLAIVGMSLWIIIAHELWEPLKSSAHKRISNLYNLTTILTLLISVTAYYLVVYILFLGMTLVLIPPGYLASELDIETTAKMIDYIKIAWFAASLSTITGAIGVGLESEKLVRDSTYGYRQRSRYKEVLENEEK